MAAGAADGFFKYVYDGCLSGGDMGIQRRPYHRNCRCALHDKQGEKKCPHAMLKCKNVSYPLKRSWSEGCLAFAAAAAGANSSSSSPPCHSSPCSSPSLLVAEVGRLNTHQRRWSHDHLDEDQGCFFKV